MGKFIDLTGQKFGRLTVLKQIENPKNNGRLWLCKCECGTIKAILGTNLTSKRIISCGCNKNEKFLNLITSHNQSKTKLYRIWHAMKDRCYREKNISYKNYGARGIKVCDEWLEFNPFYEWAVSHGYNETAKRGQSTLDRTDVNGNYEPSNCRWVDIKTQSNNKRNNFLITYKNETHTLSEWAKITGIKRDNIEYRYKKGWDLDKVFSKEIFKNKKYNKERTLDD